MLLKKKKKSTQQALEIVIIPVNRGKKSVNIVHIISVKPGFKVWSLLCQNFAFSIRNK